MARAAARRVHAGVRDGIDAHSGGGAGDGAAVLPGAGRCDAGARRLDYLAGTRGGLRVDAKPRRAWRRWVRGGDRLLHCGLFDCLHRVRAAVVPTLAIAARLPMRAFARAALPAQTIAFSSSSSIASLPALVRDAEGELQLPKNVTGFVLPLAVSVFKFAAPVSWTFGALFIAWFYQVPLGPMAYLTIALTIVFLSFAGPGVPRGAFLMLAPMFLSIGLPLEGIGILIAVDALPDIFATVLNSTGDLAAAVLVAKAQPAAVGFKSRSANERASLEI